MTCSLNRFPSLHGYRKHFCSSFPCSIPVGLISSQPADLLSSSTFLWSLLPLCYLQHEAWHTASCPLKSSASNYWPGAQCWFLIWVQALTHARTSQLVLRLDFISQSSLMIWALTWTWLHALMSSLSFWLPAVARKNSASSCKASYAAGLQQWRPEGLL